jgi:hypothetical protein
LAQAGLLCQLPLGSQVCGTLPVQREVPGVHTPVQAPAHAGALCHWPSAPQVCGKLPLHWWLPGTQTPVQLPAEQTNGQLIPFVQFPVASHV